MTTKEDDKQEGIKMVGGIQDLGHIQLQPRKRTNSNDLRILQLTDMHLFPPKDTTWILGDDKNNRVVDFIKDDYDPGNKKAVKLVKKLISSANPDLVIFTGDIIDGRPHKRRGGWRDTFGPIIEPLLKAKPPIPWTFCPGNHDDDNSPWTRKDLLQIFKLRGCATPNCVSFNHTFTVSIGTEENPHSEPSTSTRLWLFDSGGNHPKTRYDPFPKNIVKDYIEITNALKMLCTIGFTALSLMVFIWNDQILWLPGLILGAGSMLGSHLAVKFALKAKASTLKWFLFIMTICGSLAALYMP